MRLASLVGKLRFSLEVAPWLRALLAPIYAALHAFEVASAPGKRLGRGGEGENRFGGV